MHTLGGFQYVRARTVDEAVAQLAADAIVIAGGTVLTPEVAREGRDGRFVDIAGIRPLRELRVDTQGASIGALVSHDEISGHPELSRRWIAPVASDTANCAASAPPRVRAKGGIHSHSRGGGNPMTIP
jgi:CO/xanthine dehydrogenase FAD-binding subunit